MSLIQKKNAKLSSRKSSHRQSNGDLQAVMEQLKPKIGDTGQSNRFDPSRSMGPEASVDEGAPAGDKSPIQNQELRKKAI